MNQKKLLEFEKVSDGQNIKENGKSNLEQNVCGIGNYDLKFFVKNIIEISRNPLISGINLYQKMSRHIQIN